LGGWRGLEVELDEKSDRETVTAPKTTRWNEEEEVQASGKQIGPLTLFFGCRHPDVDYLYQDDFENFVDDGTLNKLYTAFSRAQEHKIYVQHRLKENEVARDIVTQLVDQGAYFFVCGDGSKMVHDVQSALTTILQQHGGMKKEEAQSYIQEMIKTHRYVTDRWS